MTIIDKNIEAAAYRFLKEVRSELWAEAKYDPKNDDTREFAARLLKKMDKANALLEFAE